MEKKIHLGRRTSAGRYGGPMESPAVSAPRQGRGYPTGIRKQWNGRRMSDWSAIVKRGLTKIKEIVRIEALRWANGAFQKRFPWSLSGLAQHCKQCAFHLTNLLASPKEQRSAKPSSTGVGHHNCPHFPTSPDFTSTPTWISF